MSWVDLSRDAKGNMSLSLRGSWSPEVEQALTNSSWDVLSILGVDWPDYRCLVPFAEKIVWLRVPFGPDSSRGLEQLTFLQRLELTDLPSPAVDFRSLPRLRWLEAIWDKKYPANLGNPNVETLVAHAVGGQDLAWIPAASKLRVLHVRGGRVLSLAGVDRASSLSELHATELKQCQSVGGVSSLRGLVELEIDAPNATVEGLNWLAGMPSLSRVVLTARAKEIDWKALAANRELNSIAVVAEAGYSISNEQIEKAITEAGRTLVSLKRYESRAPGFALEIA